MKIKRKKMYKLSWSCLVTALGVFMFSYFLYHYVTADLRISPVWLAEPQKPMVTWLFAILGVFFLFGCIFSLYAAHILYSDKEE